MSNVWSDERKMTMMKWFLISTKRTNSSTKSCRVIMTNIPKIYAMHLSVELHYKSYWINVNIKILFFWFSQKNQFFQKTSPIFNGPGCFCKSLFVSTFFRQTPTEYETNTILSTHINPWIWWPYRWSGFSRHILAVMCPIRHKPYYSICLLVFNKTVWKHRYIRVFAVT